MNRTLSIVIPCYNILENKDYVNSLLSIIYSQRCDFVTIEKIILINDSPEFNLIDFIDPLNISQKLVIKSNIKNSGQAFSRNYGLSFVRSDFVHFIDQDDLISENFYSNLKFDSDVFIAKCLLMKNNNKVMSHSKPLRRFFLKKFKTLSKLNFFLIFDNIVLSPGQVVFKTDVIRRVGGFPLLTNFGSDDYGLIFNLSKLDITYSYNENSIYFHRIHNVQGKNVLNMDASRREFLDSMPNSFFTFLCSINYFPANFIKKMLYVIFYNRF